MTLVNKLDKMFLSGFVPVSLIDFPGKISSVIFTYGCNLRCRYCHNPELVTAKKAENRMDDFFDHLQGKDIEGVAVTGGEPLFSCGIVDLCQHIKEVGYALKLDTNGTMPKKLRELCSTVIPDLVSVDIKAFNNNDMVEITRSAFELKSFYETIKVLKEYGIALELRHTVWKVPSKADVDSLMSNIEMDKLVVQFPAVNGRWLDKRFKVNLSIADVAEIKEVFKGYDVEYRNLPDT